MNKSQPLSKEHWAIFIDNSSEKDIFLKTFFSANHEEPFKSLSGLKGALFSKLELLKFIDKESRHGKSGITGDKKQPLQTMSSGEQKRVLLDYLLNESPDFLILDNPFDNLDKEFQIEFKAILDSIRRNVIIIQIISRKDDLLHFISNYARLRGNELVLLSNLDRTNQSSDANYFKGTIPSPLKKVTYTSEPLIELKNINVSYDGKPILKDISWKINKSDFWELSGKNGSGKTTLLSMITGENPKGYGQDLFLFGYKKGTGESVWDIKKNIGYFTPSMTDKFTGYHTVENMLISGILDSIGLYVRPTEAHQRLAKEWLKLINMWHLKNKLFHDLTTGQKRLIMTTRAMIKHPLLLILDEPTAGLDDDSAILLINLVNKMARESDTTIIFVSHRKEPCLNPKQRLILKSNENGSLCKILLK